MFPRNNAEFIQKLISLSDEETKQLVQDVLRYEASFSNIFKDAFDLTRVLINASAENGSAIMAAVLGDRKKFSCLFPNIYTLLQSISELNETYGDQLINYVFENKTEYRRLIPLIYTLKLIANAPEKILQRIENKICDDPEEIDTLIVNAWYFGYYFTEIPERFMLKMLDHITSNSRLFRQYIPDIKSLIALITLPDNPYVEPLLLGFLNNDRQFIVLVEDKND